MEIKGKRIHIAGSASREISPNLLKYANDLVRALVKELIEKESKFIVQVGKEPLFIENDPTSPSIIFDWTIIHTIYQCLEKGEINPGNFQESLIYSAVTHKTEQQIPSFRREMWDKLLADNIVEIEFIKSEVGELRRMKQAEQGDILILLSGGTGVERLASLYMKQAKPVIPLDLQLGSSCNDGNGGASRLAREMLAQTEHFFKLSNFQTFS